MQAVTIALRLLPTASLTSLLLHGLLLRKTVLLQDPCEAKIRVPWLQSWMASTEPFGRSRPLFAAMPLLLLLLLDLLLRVVFRSTRSSFASSSTPPRLRAWPLVPVSSLSTARSLLTPFASFALAFARLVPPYIGSGYRATIKFRLVGPRSHLLTKHTAAPSTGPPTRRPPRHSEPSSAPLVISPTSRVRRRSFGAKFPSTPLSAFIPMLL